jgi:Raf kinase inhibitor-like YbhB/YbcL family protein
VRVVASSLAALVVLSGCGGEGGGGTALGRGPTARGFAFGDGSDVDEGQSIPARFACDGKDVSPALVWVGVPAGAVELALAVEDPDAPGATFTHWLVFGLEPGSAGLASGAMPDGEGKNDFGDTGYGGPCPPGGEEHEYVFRLLALDGRSGLKRGSDRAAFDSAVGPHLLAEARLTATYERP